VPPSALRALRHVAVSKCRCILEDEGTWWWLWRLPALAELHVDLNEANGDAAVQMQALGPDGRRANRLRELTLAHCDDDAANNDPRRRPLGEHCAALLASSTELRTLRIDDARSVRGACLAALPRPGLLQALRFETGIPASPHDMIRHAAYFRNLREIAFPREEPADAAALLEQLTHVFPQLRTASFKASAVVESLSYVNRRQSDILSVEVRVAEGTMVTWSRQTSSGTTWTRRTALAERLIART